MARVPSSANVFIVTAPSGAGKTSLVTRLVHELQNIAVSVSHTTRPKRSGEADGSDYWFVDRARFEAMIDDGAFLEHAEVFDNYYGTSLQAIEDCVLRGDDVILEIDWQGAAQARKQLDNPVSIFILPPSREALISRLQGRGQDSTAVIARRTAEAVEEMRHYDAADYVLINDQFDVTLEVFKAIIISQRARRERQAMRHAALIDSLLC